MNAENKDVVVKALKEVLAQVLFVAKAIDNRVTFEENLSAYAIELHEAQSKLLGAQLAISGLEVTECGT